MNFFAFSLISVLFGIVYCGDGDCFNRKVAACNQRVLDNMVTEPDTCAVVLQQSKCVLSAAIDCQMGFIMKAQQSDLYLNKICDRSYKLFEEYRECYVTAVTVSHCYSPINDIMSNKTTSKEILKAKKEACKKGYWFERCINTSVEDTCGEFKFEIFSKVFNPIVDLYLAYCKDVLLEADENSGQYLTFGLPSIFELVADIFHYE